MKCSELMLNDWFFDASHTSPNLPLQAKCLAGDTIFADYVGSDDRLLTIKDEIDKVQPIPVTKEILKKNGWEEEFEMMSPWNTFVLNHYFVKDEEDTHLELKGGNLRVWFNYREDNVWESDITVPCKYVHHLQQMLRIVGLLELAEKFKV